MCPIITAVQSLRHTSSVLYITITHSSLSSCLNLFKEELQNIQDGTLVIYEKVVWCITNKLKGPLITGTGKSNHFPEKRQAKTVLRMSDSEKGFRLESIFKAKKVHLERKKMIFPQN